MIQFYPVCSDCNVRQSIGQVIVGDDVFPVCRDCYEVYHYQREGEFPVSGLGRMVRVIDVVDPRSMEVDE